MYRGEQPRPNSHQPAKGHSDEFGYYANFESRRGIVVYEPQVPWITILKMLGRCATKVSANHSLEVYDGIVKIWNSANSDSDRTYVPCYGEYPTASIVKEVASDKPDVYLRGIAWSLYQILIDGNTHFISAETPRLDEIVVCFREICDCLNDGHNNQVVFIVRKASHDLVSPDAIRKTVQECHDLGDVWLNEKDFEENPLEFMKKMRPAFYPQPSILNEVLKAI